jgi:hypothetical protein
METSVSGSRFQRWRWGQAIGDEGGVRMDTTEGEGLADMFVVTKSEKRVG